MTSALDQFGASLVSASRALHEDNRAAHAHRGFTAHRPSAARRFGLGRLRPRRAWQALAGAAAVGALAAAGTAILGPTGNPKEITQFECGVGAHGNVHGLFAAEPVSACAALWPSIYHRAAPALTAWVAETGGVVVVRPTGQPPSGTGWVRLPKGWRANSATIELNDQLEDITTGLPSRACWSAASAGALARSLLHSDHLGYWHVRVSTQRPAAGASGSCLSVIQAIGPPEHDTILLVETAAAPPARGVSRYANGLGPRRRLVENRVNDALRAGGRCATVAQAAALWRSYARAGGLPASDYTLNTPGPSGTGMRCARVFVNEPGGGGPANVYPADLP